MKFKKLKKYFYIYLRENAEKYEGNKVYKLGYTHNLFNRDAVYKTGELNKKKFIKIIKFTAINDYLKEGLEIEKIYKDRYHFYHIDNLNGGNEFYRALINSEISYFTQFYPDFQKFHPIILTDENDINNEIFNCRINPDLEEDDNFTKMFNSKINYIHQFINMPKFNDSKVYKYIPEIYNNDLDIKNSLNNKFNSNSSSSSLYNDDEKLKQIEQINNDKILKHLLNYNLNLTNDINYKNNKYELVDDEKVNNKKTKNKNKNKKELNKNINKKEINKKNNKPFILEDIDEKDFIDDDDILNLNQIEETKQNKDNKNNKEINKKDNKSFILEDIDEKDFIDDDDIIDNDNDIIDNDDSINDENKINDEEEENKYKLLSGFQIETLDKMIEYYKTNNKGILNICCRMGKTRISLSFCKYMKFNRILVLVPSLVLIEQWANNIKQFFKDYKIIKNDTNIKKLDNKTFYIYYYGNSNILLNFDFDIKIFDEVHHITSINVIDTENIKNRKLFRHCLNIKSKYLLSLTATLKIIDNYSIKKVISNDDKKYFGNIIDTRTFKEGIENKRLCDFKVYIIDNKEHLDLNNDEIKINQMLKVALNNVAVLFDDNVIKKNIFFVNKVNDINNICIPYFKKLSIDKNIDVDIFTYNFKENNKDILINFKNCNKGILFAVYGLSEGYDMPFLDSVCIGSKMTTNIRIVQSILRPTTYNIDNPNKKAIIILPCVYDENELKENKLYLNIDFKKVLNVIYQLEILGINVYQKIIVKDGTKMSRKNLKYKDDIIDDKLIFSSNFIQSQIFKYYKHFLKYDDAKKILKNKNINTYSKFISFQKVNSDKFPPDPEVYYKSSNFNWCDFLNIPLPSFIDIKNHIKNFNLISSIQLTKQNFLNNYLYFNNYLHSYNIYISDDYNIFCSLFNIVNLFS